MKNLIKNYNYFFFDLWGVIFDGKKIYKNTNKVLRYIHLNKKKIVLVTNSSRSLHETKKFLKKIGVNMKYINYIFTSGEFVKKKIKSSNKKVFLIDEISNQKLKYIKNLGMEITYNLQKANCALAISANKFTDNNLTTKKMKMCLKYNLELICINPDVSLINFENGMGFYLNNYINSGGKFKLYGKPSKDYYIYIMKKLKLRNKKNVLFIGDTIYNDIAGANNFGLDTLLIKKSKLHKVKIKNFNLIKKTKKNIFLPKYEVNELDLSYNFSRNY